MKPPLRTRSTPGATAALLLAALAPAGALAYHGDALPPELEARLYAEQAAAPMTREQVVAELMEAQRAGTLTPGGEIGDTEAVYAAREAYAVAQAAAIVARLQAEQAAAVAAAEAAARAAAEQAAAAAASAPTTSAAAPRADVDAVDSLSPQEMLVTRPEPEAPPPEPQAQPLPGAMMKNEEQPDTSEAPAADPRLGVG